MNRKRYALYARPSFLQGIGQLLDFGRLFDSYNHSKNGVEADRRALSSDWQAVWADLGQAIDDAKAQLVQSGRS